MLTTETTETLTTEAVEDAIFSTWRLVVSQDKSKLIRRDYARTTLKILDYYTSKLKPATYSQAFENLGRAATSTMLNLLNEAGTAEDVSSNGTMRRRAQMAVIAAEAFIESNPVGDF